MSAVKVINICTTLLFFFSLSLSPRIPYPTLTNLSDEYESWTLKRREHGGMQMGFIIGTFCPHAYFLHLIYVISRVLFCLELVAISGPSSEQWITADTPTHPSPPHPPHPSLISCLPYSIITHVAVWACFADRIWIMGGRVSMSHEIRWISWNPSPAHWSHLCWLL